MVHIISTHSNPYSMWMKFLYSNTFPNPTHVHIIKFSIAMNLFYILTWYCFSISTLLNFMRCSLSISNSCTAHLLAGSISLIGFIIVVKIKMSNSAFPRTAANRWVSMEKCTEPQTTNRHFQMSLFHYINCTQISKNHISTIYKLREDMRCNAVLYIKSKFRDKIEGTLFLWHLPL
jgi:hypothetical protein